MTLICLILQAEIPTCMGVADDLDAAMETDEIKKEPPKKYFIDTNSICVPRKGTEIQSFLKEGMSKLYCRRTCYGRVIDDNFGMIFLFLMSTHNICFYGILEKSIPELSPNTFP